MSHKDLLKMRTLLNISTSSPEEEDDLPKIVNVMLLGKTGNGKSATGNTILGNTLFSTLTGFDSCTKTVELGKVTYGKQTWQIMDTPGLFDTCEKENKSTFAEIVKTGLDFPEGVHVFVLICRVDVRFSPEERQTFLEIEEWFGKDFYKHCLLLFTHADKMITGQSLTTMVEGTQSKMTDVLDKILPHVIAIDNSLDLTDQMSKIQRSLIFTSFCRVVHGVNGLPYSHDLFQNVRTHLDIERIRLENLGKLEEYIITNYLQLLGDMNSGNLSKLQLEKEFGHETIQSISGKIGENRLLYIELHDIGKCAKRIVEKFPNAIGTILERKKNIQDKEGELERVVLKHIRDTISKFDVETLSGVLQNKELPPGTKNSLCKVLEIEKYLVVQKTTIEDCIARSLKQLEPQMSEILLLKEYYRKKIKLNNHISGKINDIVKSFIRHTQLKHLQKLKGDVVNNENKLPNEILVYVRKQVPEDFQGDDYKEILEEVCMEIFSEKKNSLLAIIDEEIKIKSSCFGFIRRCIII